MQKRCFPNHHEILIRMQNSLDGLLPQIANREFHNPNFSGRHVSQLSGMMQRSFSLTRIFALGHVTLLLDRITQQPIVLEWRKTVLLSSGWLFEDFVYRSCVLVPVLSTLTFVGAYVWESSAGNRDKPSLFLIGEEFLNSYPITSKGGGHWSLELHIILLCPTKQKFEFLTGKWPFIRTYRGILPRKPFAAAFFPLFIH